MLWKGIIQGSREGLWDDFQFYFMLYNLFRRNIL